MKITLLFTCMIAGYCLTAAPMNRNIHKGKAHDNSMWQYILEQQANSPQVHKGTSVLRRLIATGYSKAGVLTDSAHHYYSGGRGSTHNGVGSYFNTYVLTSENQDQPIKSDSSKGWNDFGSGLTYNGNTVYVYNPDNKVIKEDYLSPYIAYKYTGTYNSAGNLETTTFYDTFGGTAFIPKSKSYIIYDNQNRRIADSTVDVINNMQIAKREYVYDNNGNMLTFSSYVFQNNQWQPSFKTTSIYDNNNRVITIVEEGDYGNGYMNQQKDSFAYNGTAMQPATHISYTWDVNNSKWAEYEMLVNSYNAQNQVDTYIIHRWTTQWDTLERDVYIYDSYGLMVRSNGYTYTGNGQYSTVPYDQTNLYYEDYYPATVNTLKGEETGITIYPNPSSASIQFELNKTGNITIADMQGRIAYRETGLQPGNKEIAITSLPAGSYSLVIYDNAGNRISQGRFMKQ